MDQGRQAALIDLPPQVADVDVDQVHERVALVLPYVLSEVAAAHDLTHVAHQGLEDRILPRSQADGSACPHDLMAEGIERKVLARQEGRPGQLGGATHTWKPTAQRR